MKRISTKILSCLLSITILISCNDHSTPSTELENDDSQELFTKEYENDTMKRTIRNQDTAFSKDGTEDSYSQLYDSIWPAGENDTARILFFRGHEVSDIPKNQFYWKVLKIDDSLFKRERVRIEDIVSSTFQNGGILKTFEAEPLKFIYTGLTACNGEIKGDDRKREIKYGDSVLVQQNEKAKIFMAYKNDQITMVKYSNGRIINKQSLTNLKDLYNYNQSMPTQLTVVWIGDIDCDNLNEVTIYFEIEHTINYWTLKTLNGLDYYVIAPESMFWD